MCPPEYEFDEIVWTDYPFVELGEEPGKFATWKSVVFLSYDGNKYADVQLSNGEIASVKIGYLFKTKEAGIETLYGDANQMEKATIKESLNTLRLEVIDFEQRMYGAGLIVPVIATPETPIIKSRWLRWNGEQITLEVKGDDNSFNIKNFDEEDLHFAIPLLKVLHNNAVDAFNQKNDKLVEAIIEVRRIKSECFGDK